MGLTSAMQKRKLVGIQVLLWLIGALALLLLGFCAYLGWRIDSALRLSHRPVAPAQPSTPQPSWVTPEFHPDPLTLRLHASDGSPAAEIAWHRLKAPPTYTYAGVTYHQTPHRHSATVFDYRAI